MRPASSASSVSGQAPPISIRSTVALTVSFVLVFLISRFGLKWVEPGSGQALALALAPLVPFVGLIYGYARCIGAGDELERRIQLEALAIAYPSALTIAFIAGLLDLAGFHGRGNWDLPRLWPLMVLPYLISLWIVQRRYHGRDTQA